MGFLDSIHPPDTYNHHTWWSLLAIAAVVAVIVALSPEGE